MVPVGNFKDGGNRFVIGKRWFRGQHLHQGATKTPVGVVREWVWLGSGFGVFREV